MVLLIRRVWTASFLLLIISVIMAGAPDVMAVDAQTYVAFLVGAVWAPVAFVLTMAQQATGKSAPIEDGGNIL